MKKILSLALVFVMMFAFVSCGKSIDSIEKKLEDADYKVEVVELDEATDEGVVKTLHAVGENGIITAVEFEKSSDAKEYYNEMKDEFEEAKEEGYIDEDAKFGDLCIKSGKVVITASSEDAMKDVK
jgi:hypothetical protein